MSKPKFECTLCGYITDKKQSYEKHNVTKKHLTRKQLHDESNNKIEESTIVEPLVLPDISDEKIQRVSVCDLCNKSFTSMSRFERHYIACYHGEVEDDTSLDREMDEYYDNLVIEFESEKDLGNKGDKTVRALISNYVMNILPEYIGNVMVSYYKMEDPHNQCVWSTDIDNLTFFVKKDFGWDYDPEGLEMSEIIIAPVLRHFTEKLNIHIDTVLKEEPNERELEICEDILKMIRNGTLRKGVIEIMAIGLFLNIDFSKENQDDDDDD